MPPRVSLTATNGQLDGQEYVFSERSTCLVGRSKDCQIKIPSNKSHIAVSRHHCLLDINPPEVRVRDFGSLNGTHVNDKLIGKRKKDQSPDQGQEADFPEQDLADGDLLRVHQTTFRVSVDIPIVCEECDVEIDQANQANSLTGDDIYVCYSCRAKSLVTGSAISYERKAVCVTCGRDVSSEVGPHRGEYVCTACQADPFKMLKQLLKAAKSGERQLSAIDGYEIIKPLGKGGMGAVYLARHKATDVLRALKIMLPRAAASPRCCEMFLRESENTKALEHPNIVRLHDTGYSQGSFFFTMEYCDLGGVDALLRARGKPYAVEEAAPIILPCLDGLEYAHNALVPNVKLRDGTSGTGRGLVHRDISPHNILVSRVTGQAVPKIADFGLSKAFDLAGLSGLTCSGGTAGKPFFMCRQQLIDYKHAKPEVDVWAMTATLYSMLTGYAPRNFSKDKDVWKTVLQDTPVPIRQRDSRIPRKLADVIDTVLDDRKQLHFTSAGQLKSAIEDAL